MVNPLLAIWRKSDFDQRRKPFLCHLYAVRVIGVEQNHSILRHDIDQAPEAELDFVEVAKNIGVIELDIVYDQQLGEIMNELRALVEKRGVVFVALDHEVF